jgi:hypothetical protein
VYQILAVQRQDFRALETDDSQVGRVLLDVGENDMSQFDSVMADPSIVKTLVSLE